MKNRFGKFLVTAIFFLLVTFSFNTAFAQTIPATPTPNPKREALILSIQQSAQKDVAQGAARQSTSELQALFGDAAKDANISLNEVKNIYNAAYQAALPVKSPWDDLLTLQNGGWLVALVMLVLFILRDTLKDLLTKFFNLLIEAAYQRLARFRPFWWIALRRYRRSLEGNFRELKIPFRSGRPLLMKDVYVPLRGQDGERKAVDVFGVIQQQRKLMVLGDPGSGKTMLLRHIAFNYAKEELNDFPGQPIPIYLELNRLKAENISLITALTRSLETNNFPGAESFLKAHLEMKDLLILLDGLDEVDSAARPDVVRQVKDLTQQYPENRLLITCRKAVYQSEFADWADQQLEIIDFNDQQIQRFMTSWQVDMPPGKSIEHFIRNLQERPQIMTLARNPLLLTMIAYLYTDTEFALPHSRSEFYSKSTDLLLDQWKLERNRYKAAHKRLVLQHLARFNQEQSARTGERRTMGLTAVLDEIRSILPDLTLETKDAQPLLDEITQRSGLLLAIDGGLLYQFTHLTLQEYFAACALKDKANILLENFRRAPDDWREVLRLWCSLEHDCTEMLKEIYAMDAVLALECLSDAQQVDTAYADELLENFKPRLNEVLYNEALAKAFALLAADPSKIGAEWFHFLENRLVNAQFFFAVCTVLAQTNSPQAAQSLTQMAARNPQIRPFLVKLGNLAVYALTKHIQRGEIWAMDALAEIGTPSAALVLQTLLWTDDKPAYLTAWRLATLLPLPSVEEKLSSVPLTTKQRKMDQIAWVWEPFDEPNGSSLSTIAGRIAHLLYTTPTGLYTYKSLLPYDLRIVLPLCIIFAKNPFNYLKPFKNQVPVLQYLYFSLSEIRQRDVALILMLHDKATKPSSDDWRNLFRPIKYIFETSAHEKLIKIMFILLVGLNFWAIWKQISQSSTLLTWSNIWALFLGFILLISFNLWFSKKWKLSDVGTALSNIGILLIITYGINRFFTNWISGELNILFTVSLSIFYGVIGIIWGAVEGIKRGGGQYKYTIHGKGKLRWFIGVFVGALVGAPLGALLLIIFGGIIGGLLGYPSELIYDFLGSSGIVVFWLVWLGYSTFVYWSAKRMERRANNPLHGLLDDVVPGRAAAAGSPLLRWLRWGK